MCALTKKCYPCAREDTDLDIHQQLLNFCSEYHSGVTIAGTIVSTNMYWELSILRTNAKIKEFGSWISGTCSLRWHGEERQPNRLLVHRTFWSYEVIPPFILTEGHDAQRLPQTPNTPEVSLVNLHSGRAFCLAKSNTSHTQRSGSWFFSPSFVCGVTNHLCRLSYESL